MTTTRRKSFAPCAKLAPDPPVEEPARLHASRGRLTSVNFSPSEMWAFARGFREHEGRRGAGKRCG